MVHTSGWLSSVVCSGSLGMIVLSREISFSLTHVDIQLETEVPSSIAVTVLSITVSVPAPGVVA